MMRLIRILIVGFVLWLLCGAVPGHAVPCAPADAELSAADGFADQLRCEQLYNSDFNFTCGAAEVMPQPVVRVYVRTADFVSRPVPKSGAACDPVRGAAAVVRPLERGSAPIVSAPAVDYYIYRLRRLII